MACKTLENEDLGEDEIQPAPKLLEVILQNCRGRVDNYLPLYMQASTRHTCNSDISNVMPPLYFDKVSHSASQPCSTSGQEYLA